MNPEHDRITRITELLCRRGFAHRSHYNSETGDLVFDWTPAGRVFHLQLRHLFGVPERHAADIPTVELLETLGILLTTSPSLEEPPAIR